MLRIRVEVPFMDRRAATRIPAIDQHARFLETARALGCDEDEAAFDEKLQAVVGPKAELKLGDKLPE